MTRHRAERVLCKTDRQSQCQSGGQHHLVAGLSEAIDRRPSGVDRHERRSEVCVDRLLSQHTLADASD